MPDLQSELSKVVRREDRLSVRQYVLQKVTERPGIAAIDVVKQRPAYLKPTSVSPMLTYLARGGALRRAATSSHQGRGTFVYWVADASASPNKGRKAAKEFAKFEAANRDKSQPDLLKWRKLGDYATQSAEPAPQTEPRREPPNHTADGKPRLLIQVNGKQRVFTLEEAREIFSQLKGIFG